jgi:hypothetical protein
VAAFATRDDRLFEEVRARDLRKIPLSWRLRGLAALLSARARERVGS